MSRKQLINHMLAQSLYVSRWRVETINHSLLRSCHVWMPQFERLTRQLHHTAAVRTEDGKCWRWESWLSHISSQSKAYFFRHNGPLHYRFSSSLGIRCIRVHSADQADLRITPIDWTRSSSNHGLLLSRQGTRRRFVTRSLEWRGGSSNCCFLISSYCIRSKRLRLFLL